MNRRTRRGLSNVVATVLLILMAVIAVTAVYGVYNTIFRGATSNFSVLTDGSIIAVSPQNGAGMILIVMKNQGPGVLNLRALNITDENANQINIQPTSSTTATITCVGTGCWSQVTGTIVGGPNVGFVATGGYLVIPVGQTASFQFNFNSGLNTSFTPNNSYTMIIVPRNAAVVRTTIEATAQ